MRIFSQIVIDCSRSSPSIISAKSRDSSKRSCQSSSTASSTRSRCSASPPRTARRHCRYSAWSRSSRRRRRSLRSSLASGVSGLLLLPRLPVTSCCSPWARGWVGRGLSSSWSRSQVQGRRMNTRKPAMKARVASQVQATARRVLGSLMLDTEPRERGRPLYGHQPPAAGHTSPVIRSTDQTNQNISNVALYSL